MKPFYRATCILLCFFFLSVSGSTQQLSWAHRTGNSLIDVANSVTTDNAGNVYISGKFEGTNVDFDPSPAGTFLLSSMGSSDAFLAKYDASGQFVWAFRFGGTDRDEAWGIRVDQNNDIFITGFFRGAGVDFDPGPGVVNLTSNGDSGADPGYGGDIFVAKYSSAGQYIWAFNIGGIELYDAGIAVELDAIGNVYVAGYFKNTADFDPSLAGTTILNSNTGSMFIAKYTAAGAFQWAFNLGSGTADNSMFDLKVDPAGNVYATGFYQGTDIDFDPSAATAFLNSNGGYEIFLAKYNTNGQYQFATSIGAAGDDVGRSLALDNSGNIYLLGDFHGTVDFNPGPGTALLTSNGQGDVFFAKYNSGGQYQWAFNFGGTPNEFGWKVAIDGIHLFITGGFGGTADFDPSPNVENLTSAGLYDIFVGKYTLNGEYLCAFGIGGTGDDYGMALFSNASNSFFLTGAFMNANVDFDPGAGVLNLSSAGAIDIFLAKYLWPDNPVPAGTLTGDAVCTGEQAQLTFTATAGVGPFTLIYTNGVTNITQTNVQSGIPFNITPNPVTTTVYTLVSIKDAQRCAETNFTTGTSATVTVNSCLAFSVPDTVCVNTPVNIINTSTNASTSYWNFCSGSLNATPSGSNFTSPGFSLPAFSDMVQDGNNYYVFVVNHMGSLARMSFGSSLLNTPTVTNLGSFGGIIPFQAEGIEIQKDGGNWIGYIIGGQYANSRLLKLSFGTSVANTPTATNLGNVGGLDFPVDFTLQKDATGWYGFTVSADNNTVTRYSFGNSLNNAPVATNLGNIGSLNYPVGIFMIKDGSNYHLFITNRNSHTISRLDFGTSLANAPMGTNLGNPGNYFNWPRDITVIRDCDKTFGFVVNEGTHSLTRLDFTNNNLLSTPASTNLGNIGNMNFPSSISEIFRTGDAVNFISTNVSSNSITRITFANCTASSIPSYSGQNPPPFQYNQPGEYNISLFADEGLATQNVTCKKIVVVAPPVITLGNDSGFCANAAVILGSTLPQNVAYLWSTTQTTQTITVQQPGSYWVTIADRYGCSAADTVNLVAYPAPHVSISPGSDTAVCNNIPFTITATGGNSYTWSTGQTGPSININAAGSYIVNGMGPNGCVAADTIGVTHYLIPVSAGNDTLVCQGQQIQLHASGGVTYSWSPGIGLNDPAIANPVAMTTNDMTYYVTVTNADNCSNIDSVKLTIRSNPQFAINAPVSVCTDHTAQLNASGGDIYSWTPAGSLNNAAIAGPVASPQTTTTYAVNITDTVCHNTTQLSTVVTVLSLPTITATKSNDIDCSNDRSQLNASGAKTYTWTPAISLNNATVANPVAMPTAGTMYVVKGIDASGCSNYDSVLVSFSATNASGYFMPNAFTPNGDGLNDCYGIRFWGVIQDLEFSIYNRWGERIFFTKNPNDCWDGTYKGTKQGSAVYVFVIKAKTICGDTFKKGLFTLVR